MSERDNARSPKRRSKRITGGKKADPNRQRVALAYHEAGHAVLNYKRQLPFKYVTIKPDDNSAGHLRALDRKPKWGWVFVDNVVCVLAGVVAEKRFTGRSDFVRTDHDLQAALYFATARNRDDAHYDENDPLPQAIIRGAWRQAQKAVEWWWPAVKAVAEALLERETLTEREVGEICDSDAVIREQRDVQRSIFQRNELKREQELAKYDERQAKKTAKPDTR